MLGLDAGTVIALAAMLITLFGAAVKYIDRVHVKRKEANELAKKQSTVDVERDSIVVRGAEGALLLMEKTLKVANDECDKRILELEEENADLKCQLADIRQDFRELKQEMKDLTIRVRRVE